MKGQKQLVVGILVSLFLLILFASTGILQAQAVEIPPDESPFTPLPLPLNSSREQPGNRGTWQWYLGSTVYSSTYNCVTQTWVPGTATYVGYFADPDNFQPSVGSVYYVVVYIYGVGNACSGTYALVDLKLPPNTQLAISTTNPVICYFKGNDASDSCPSGLVPSSWNSGYYTIPSPGASKTWPLAWGASWEFQVPVKSSTTLSGANLESLVRSIDGYNDSWLRPTMGIYVFGGAQPGAFNKTAPINGSKNNPRNLSLSWGNSTNATSYEYCLDKTAGTTCTEPWNSVGPNRTVYKTGLTSGVYYWQVRAKNTTDTTLANNGTWWSFTVPPKPGAFSKTLPANNAINRPTNPTLSWGSSSNAAKYEYCIDKVNDGKCNSSWVSTGTSRSKALSGLTKGAKYYWQVRAKNAVGTTIANSGTWRSFTTIP